MKKRNICVVITARPSYSRVKTALLAIREHPELNLQLVIAASALLDRYGSVVKYIEDDGLEITRKIYTVLEGENLISMAKTTGIGISELATVFDDLKPDVVVTIADRYETISTAIAASYMNIPLAHIQGGEVTGNIDEKVRHAITKLSDLHLVTTPMAAERVIKMGENPVNVYTTGCPSIDLAAEVKANPALDFDPISKYGGVGAEIKIEPGKYLVVMQHPVTTSHEHAQEEINATLDAILELDMPTMLFWPNVDAGSDGTSRAIRIFREKHRDNKLHYFKNMKGTDFLRILSNSLCLIGNSSVGIRECSYLGVPVVNLGNRQNRRDRGPNVLDVDYNKDAIVQAVRHQMQHGPYESDYIYGNGNAGISIAEVLANAPLGIEKVLMY
ncbi:UDP-N-acetylglucosamine 2-epimerase (hydrolyzing) [Nibribacter ruber]|uniref:UDP-N-acetylglucosamine 2-epimerase (Hydrolyzing) n=1 Tax=Nibribacter ruber TaxID=2698458 RepID=A0A6P1P3N4_9BACT|nr:UDP-N-acetylglucosamine 2-epimerase [Nibribacter ruber]QHL89047.1 UDP-N-acetylglucosamine 2-epimerase (hydrolyzing) [Nibribacter ruber]